MRDTTSSEYRCTPNRTTVIVTQSEAPPETTIFILKSVVFFHFVVTAIMAGSGPKKNALKSCGKHSPYHSERAIVRRPFAAAVFRTDGDVARRRGTRKTLGRIFLFRERILPFARGEEESFIFFSFSYRAVKKNFF